MATIGIATGQDAHDDPELLLTSHSDACAFAAAEQLALGLYDQLHDLELQLALLEAQPSGTVADPAAHVNMAIDATKPAPSPDLSALADDALREQLTVAQHEAMEARAEYEIRNRITHHVLVMDPVLQAVHRGEQTSAAAKRLLPLITENDTVSMLHGAQTTKLASVTRALSTAEQANLTANHNNRALAQTMLALAEDMRVHSVKDIDDPTLQAQVDAVEKSLKGSRQRKKTLKGILSAMVVGSGIKWAADEGLTELVMDDEDD